MDHVPVIFLTLIYQEIRILSVVKVSKRTSLEQYGATLHCDGSVSDKYLLTLSPYLSANKFVLPQLVTERT